MRALNKKAVTIVAAGAIAVGGSGIAYAYWSTNGSGTGTAATSAGAASLELAQTSTISNMFPGDQAQTISGTVKNTAANAAYVTSVTASIASVTKAANAPAGTCDATDYTLANPTMTIGQDVAAGATVPFTGASIKFNNKTTSQDACKGATVNLAYAAL